MYRGKILKIGGTERTCNGGNMSLDHVGGHLDMTHTDAGAIKWLSDKGVVSFLDVGCSVGGQVELAGKIHMRALGLDGDYDLSHRGLLKVPSRILFCDFTKTFIKLPFQFDAVWCVEVAEHIEEKFVDNLMKTICWNASSLGMIVFTASQGPGIHHVNLKPMEWWIDKFKEYWFVLSDDLTKELRTSSTMDRDFVRDKGCVFVWDGGIRL